MYSTYLNGEDEISGLDGEGMETRKVQKSGNSSFVVSLPADWVKAHGIKKNAPVYVEQNIDGSLSILVHAVKEKSAAPVVIKVTGKERKSMLFRKMVAAYIAGSQGIEIHPVHGQFASASSLVSTYTASTVGQEVVEETETKISVNDVLNPSELPMRRVVRRMHSICQKMVAAAVITIGGGDASEFNMDAMERDMDRLLWLAARKHHQFLRFPSIAAAEGIGLTESHLLFMASRYMERIGDHAFSIFSEGSKSNRLHEFGKFAEEQYSKSSSALFDKNGVLAHQVIEDVLSRKAPSGEMKNRSFTASEVSSFASIRRIAEYSAGICENLIDFAASQEQ